MHPVRTPGLTAAFLAAALAMTTTSCASAHTVRSAPRYFEVVNTSHDSVIALAIAPAGNDAFHPIDIGKPLPGGLAGITVDVPSGGCQRALRVTFHDGRALLYPKLDLCRYRKLILTPRDGRTATNGG